MAHDRPSNRTANPRRMSRRTDERPWLLIFFGALGLGGCAALILGMLIALIYVANHDWIADTISELAAREWQLGTDVALYGFAAGLMATALSAAHAHLGKVGWTAGVISLAVLAGLVLIIGARAEYGDNEGVVIHMYVVYTMGALFLLVSAAMQSGLRVSGHRHAGRWLIGLGAGWAVMLPVFRMSPTWIEGLLEPILGLLACGMIAVLSLVFLQRGLRGAKKG